MTINHKRVNKLALVAMQNGYNPYDTAKDWGKAYKAVWRDAARRDAEREARDEVRTMMALGIYDADLI